MRREPARITPVKPVRILSPLGSLLNLRALLIAILALAGYASRAPAAEQPARWQSEFAAFTRADELHHPEQGGVVFVGSSSIRLWGGVESAFGRVPSVVKGGLAWTNEGLCGL